MRRLLTTTLFLACGLLAIGRVFTVRSGGSIAGALSAAKDRDTVLVSTGTYIVGTLTIERSIVLLGEGWPVVDGGGKGEVIIVNASNVTISGIVVRGTLVSDLNDNAAIKCVTVSDITITGNRIEKCFFGIYLSNVMRATIADNEVHGDPAVPETRRANGIHLWKCNSVHVLRNHSTDHRDGIYLEFVTDSHIDHNVSASNSRYGLHFMFSHRDSYTHNLFGDNGAGVAVMFTKEVVMTDNRFEQNRGGSAYGLLLKEINDVRIERNIFTDNTVGMMVDGCNRAVIRDNRFTANGWAVRVYANSTAVRYEGNAFSGNTFDMTTNGDLVNSTLIGNYWDRYTGYDLDRDGVGDVPFRPLSVFALVTERMPFAMVLSRSLMVNLLDQSERVIPTMTPAALEDKSPLMRPPHG